MLSTFSRRDEMGDVPGCQFRYIHVIGPGLALGAELPFGKANFISSASSFPTSDWCIYICQRDEREFLKSQLGCGMVLRRVGHCRTGISRQSVLACSVTRLGRVETWGFETSAGWLCVPCGPS